MQPTPDLVAALPFLESCAVLAEMRPLDREVYIDHKLLGQPQWMIAERLGVSRARVYQRFRNAKGVLEKAVA